MRKAGVSGARGDCSQRVPGFMSFIQEMGLEVTLSGSTVCVYQVKTLKGISAVSELSGHWG